MPNVRDSEDAFLSAQADFEDWQEKFLLDWYAPYIVLQLGMMRRASPMVEQQRPGMDMVNDLIKKMSGGI